MRWALVAGVLFCAADARGEALRRDCALGFLNTCAIESERRVDASPPRLRVELFVGYKPSYGYYGVEQRSCEAMGCRLRLDGALLMFDAFARLWGNPRSDDFFDLGLSYSVVPVVSHLSNNPRGFEGELGPIAAGDGDLSYSTLRLTLRRPSFFYLVKSKYLVSSFGLGVAFPIGSGAGRTFTGADGVKFTLGGRLGVQVPLNDTFSVGVGTSYGVVWYGTAFGHVAYVGGYGLNLQWLL